MFGDINDPGSDAAKLLAANQGRVVRVIAKNKDTRPNMYYLASTAPDGWAVQPVDPLSFDFLAGLVAPAVKWAVGLSGLGVLVMLGRQLLAGAGAAHGSGGSHDTGGSVSSAGAPVAAPVAAPVDAKKEDGHA